MKQDKIVHSKMWDGLNNKKDIFFPTEFYSQKDVLKGIGRFDLKNVTARINFGKTDKGFLAYIVSLHQA